jgi:hypothetical protein
MNFTLQSKLGALALSALLLFATVPTVGCSGVTVAQDIVNWTPTIISAAQTIDATVATLDPANAAVILLAGTTFTAAATLVEAQAKTYLANPTATALQQLQAQALAFQSNVSTALLQAARITNSASQQKITVAINAAVTGISAILALITTIKGSTVTPASVTANSTVAAAMRLVDRHQAIALVAQHYGEPQFMAAYQMQAAGF